MQVKAADSRQPDVHSLERLLDRSDLPSATRKRIEVEIRNIQAGERAERDAAYQIELYFGRSESWATIHDLRIEVDGLAAQIDHLLINRLADIWVCESKSFGEGVSINDHGEWSRWWHGRQEGMASPIEQNRRHIHLLQRVFDDGLAPLPRRLGVAPMKPRLRSLILVSDNARISRPKRLVGGLEEVIKAEQLKTRVLALFDELPPWDLARAMGKEGLEKFARGLAALHRTASIDWAARFGLPPGPVSARPSSAGSIEPGPNRLVAAARATRAECVRCGRSVSEAVARYCGEHTATFGGSIYCMECQPMIRTRAEHPLPVPEWSAVLARYRTATRLRTVARQAPFIVVTEEQSLRVMPDSSGRGRTLTRADFERAAPLLGHHGRGEVNETSRNSSYVEAILADFRQA